MWLNRNRNLADHHVTESGFGSNGYGRNGAGYRRMLSRGDALMERTPPINQYDEELRPDVLISRMIDGIAGTDDREAFERMATVQPELWRELALRQEDAVRLSADVEPILEQLEGVCAPIESAGNARRHRWLTMPVALSGWAAMIIVGLTWAITAMMHANQKPVMGEIVSPRPTFLPYTFMEHRARYEQAPWVLGEMQPSPLEWQELSDGRIALRFLRRSEEVVIVETAEAADELVDPDTGEINEQLLKQIREGEDFAPKDQTPPDTQ